MKGTPSILAQSRALGLSASASNRASASCHALHVLGAVVWLVILLVGARQGRFTVERHLPVELGAIYWYYVSAVWAVIFPLAYLGLR